MSYSNENLRETHIVGPRTREQIVSPHLCQAMNAAHILLVGISYALPPFRFVRMHSSISQILFCIEGTGHVLVNGEWRACGPGSVYITPAGALHAYHAVDEHVPWKIGWITYDDHVPESRAQSLEHPVIDLLQPSLVQTETSELALALEGLYHESMGQVDTATMQLWVQLLQTYALRVRGQQSSDLRLQRLWRLIDTNIAYAWTCNEMADYAGMSSEHLRRLCQQQTGHSPMRHVMQMRMQRAMALLSSDNYPVTFVAERVGYDNPFAFSTAFKRYAGISPSEYRAHVRAQGSSSRLTDKTGQAGGG